jgi:hypothetical protein
MNIKSNIIDKVILFICLSLCAFHFVGIVYYSKKIEQSSLPIEGSIEGHLGFTHLVLLILLIGYLVTLFSKALISKITSLFISSLILGFYFWWYYEKFDSLATEGTEEYNWQISEFGLLRGATELDYWVFFITLLLVIYAVFTFSYKLAATKEKLK